MIKTHYRKILIVSLLITAGLLLDMAGLFDADKMLKLARGHADQWWLVLALILLQVLLYTFALAGSSFLWIVAPLYPPVMATFILAAGGTLGGITAYLFSRRLTDDWNVKIGSSRTYKLLHQQDNFFVLFALRVLPAFPHSLINYSSGILKVKLSHFILAAILGISIKSYIYAQVVYNAASSATAENLFTVSTYGPLVLLSIITITGVFIRYQFTRTRDRKKNE